MPKSYRISKPFFDDDNPFDEFVERTKAPENQPAPAAWDTLLALQGMPHVYAGTVDPAVKADRRRRNKVARKSRRRNRGR